MKKNILHGIPFPVIEHPRMIGTFGGKSIIQGYLIMWFEINDEMNNSKWNSYEDSHFQTVGFYPTIIKVD